MFKLNFKQLINLTARSTITYPYLLQKIKPHRSLHTIRNINTRVLTSNSLDDRNEDKDYLVKLKNDPDIFGDNYTKEEIDEDDLREEAFISNPPDPAARLRTKQYADIIKDLIKKRRIKEAIDVIEVRMLKDDKVKPEGYIFNLVIGACGRVGYTKKAFSLFNDMKKRGLKVHPGTYTALFNACANSPWPKDGLQRAKHLHELMIEKRYEPNDTNYNSMIKAYGRCGDLVAAFSLVDEMINKKFEIKDDTLNFLLQACISEPEAGFRHALLVWRKFVDKKVAPSLFSYNLMLRCIRDCSLGDVETTRDVISRLLPENDKFLLLNSGNNDINDQIGTSESKDDLNSPTSELTTLSRSPINEIKLNRPNLMAPIPSMGDIISLSEVKKPEDRLLLVGGVNSFLQNMADNQSVPDIKTFSLLMDCVPNSLNAEKELLAAMKKNNVEADLDFYNLLIKRRSMRSDYQGGVDVVRLMKKKHMKPDLVTYGVLALGCKEKEEALDLINEMKSKNYRLNTETLGGMLQQACFHRNFSYVLEVMELTLREGIQPNKKFMEHLDKFKKKMKDVSNEKNVSKKFMKGYNIFNMRYKTWLKEVKVEEEEHPWQQFREPTETDVRHYKDKTEASKFKPRHLSKFRVKTSPKHISTGNTAQKSTIDASKDKLSQDSSQQHIPAGNTVQ